MKVLLSILCSLCLIHPSFGEDLPSVGHGLSLGFCRLEPSTFMGIGPDASHYDKGVKALSSAPGWPQQFDVREFLAGRGFALGPGEEAIYEPALNLMILRAKADTIGVIKSAFNSAEAYFDSPLQITATLVEFSAKRADVENAGTSYKALRDAAGRSWCVLSRITVATRTDTRVHAVARARASGAKSSMPTFVQTSVQTGTDQVSPLTKHEFGTETEMEPVYRPDGHSFGLNLVYDYRSRNGMQWSTLASTSVVVGTPTVLLLHAAGQGTEHSRLSKVHALILEVNVVNPPPPVAPTADQAREKEKQANPGR